MATVEAGIALDSECSTTEELDEFGRFAPIFAPEVEPLLSESGEAEVMTGEVVSIAELSKVLELEEIPESFESFVGGDEG